MADVSAVMFQNGSQAAGSGNRLFVVSAMSMILFSMPLIPGCKEEARHDEQAMAADLENVTAGMRAFDELEWRPLPPDDAITLLRLVENCDGSPYVKPLIPGQPPPPVQFPPHKYEFYVEYSAENRREFSLTEDGALLRIRSGNSDELKADPLIGWELFACGAQSPEVVRLMSETVAKADPD